MLFIFRILCLIVFLTALNFVDGNAESVLMDLNHANDWRSLHHTDSFQDTENGFSFNSLGHDPYILSKPLQFSTTQYTGFEIEMRVTAGSKGQIFWTTDQNPNTSEPQSVRFDLIADGRFHTYRLTCMNHEFWKGEIQHIRLDPTDSEALVEIRGFRIIDRLGPDIRPIRFSPKKPFAQPGEEIPVSIRFANVGDLQAEMELRLVIPFDSIVNDPHSLNKTIFIPPGGEGEAVWVLKSEEEGAYPAVCKWETCNARPHTAKIGSRSTLAQFINSENQENRIVLKIFQGRVTFLQTSMGYGPVRMEARKGEKYHDAAWMARLGTVRIQLNNGEMETWPVFSKSYEKRGDGSVLFDQTWKDRDGRQWTFELTASPGVITDTLGLTYRLTGEGGKLLHFSGPELYVGESSFGRRKDLAVFPGIEYIDREAVSSSDAVAHPPVRDHYMPHPYKVTVPYMALTQDEILVALLWPPLASWARGECALSPKFAVPNRIDGQENHLMGLFVPPVPHYTHENEETAYEPYILQPGETVEIKCAVYLAQSSDPNDALNKWLLLYSRDKVPDPEPSPRSYEESIALSRQAYLSSCWDENVKGWGHCVGWDAHPSGGMLALLSIDEFLCNNEEAKKILQERIHLVKETILKTEGPAGLGNPSGCHVMTFEPAFYWGVSEYKLPHWRRQAQNYVQSQNPDGSWGFHPSREIQKPLGKEGEVVSGTISPYAMFLMRFARITGDPTATEGGLKALEALNARTVPRGAQGWECPLAAADILVSGHGARANLDAYRITGDYQYLEKAVYWARSGIVFHYLWNLEDRPLQKYATIPIFGTTFFSHSWRGVPVQWCGLVYAYALQELAPYDDSQPWETSARAIVRNGRTSENLKRNQKKWETIARGIVNSALWQQLTEGELIGTLPDSYGDYCLTARGAFINPENIMTNLHALEGNSLNIRTAFVESPGIQSLRVSANADIQITGASDPLQFNLTSKKGRLTEALIAPLRKKPGSVSVTDGPGLNEMETLYSQSFGWRYLEEYQTLLIHAVHDKKQIGITIQE